MALNSQKIPKIGKKLIAAMLIVSLIPLGAIGIQNITYTYSQLSMTKDEQLKTTATDLSIYTDAILSQAKNVIEQLSLNPLTSRTAIKATEWNESQLWDSYEGENWDIEQNLTNFKESIPWNGSNDIDSEYSIYLNDLAIENGFSEIFVTESRGFVYASTSSVPGDFAQEGEDWWTAARQSSTGSFFEFGYDDSTGQYLMDVVKEVVLQNGTFVGMIKAGYDVTSLSIKLEEAIVTDTISFFSINNEGIIFTHTITELVGKNVTSILPLSYLDNKDFLTMINTEPVLSGNSLIRLYNSSFRCGFSKLNQWNIIIFVIEDNYVIERAIYNQLVVFILIFFFMAFVIVIAVFRLSSSLIQPVIRLTEISKEVAEGNFEIKINEIDKKRKDEFGELTNSFSIMIRALDDNRKALIEAKEEYQALVENLEEGVLLEDENEIIAFVNRKLVEMLEYSNKEELIGKGTSFIIPQTELEKIRIETMKRPKGIRGRYESSILSKDKELIPVLVSANPIFSENDDFQGVLSVFTDITEQKKLQDLRDRFIATTNHELRTPATVIKGFIDFLLLDPNIPPKERNQVYFSLARNIDRLIRLMDSIYDLSRISEDMFTISPQPVKKDDLVILIREQVGILYPKRLITVDYITSGTNQEDVLFDQDRILQAVHNLISNAVKNSPTRSPIEIILLEAHSELRITIQDYGVGIPIANLFQLFQPFSHIDTEYSSSGTGLGLFIVKSIALAHGGAIEVFSQENIGTAVTIKIPIK